MADKLFYLYAIGYVVFLIISQIYLTIAYGRADKDGNFYVDYVLPDIVEKRIAYIFYSICWPFLVVVFSLVAAYLLICEIVPLYVLTKYNKWKTKNA